MIEFTIPLATPPCPRPRVTEKRVYYPSTYEEWFRDAAVFIPTPLWEGPIWVEMTFHGGRGDLDNKIKSLLDLGTGRLWVDDRQVERIVAEKFPVLKQRDKRTVIKAGQIE